jgi:hypothetical protein
MSRASIETRRQAAADAVGTIADTVKELSDLLDQFFENHQGIGQAFDDAFPWHSEINRDVVKRLNQLSSDLEPPDGGKGEE